MRLNDLCNSQWEDLTKNHLPHPLLSQILLSLQTGSGDTAGILIVLIPRRVFVLWHTMWVWAATTCIEDWGGSLKQLFLLSWSVSSVIPLQGSDAFQCLHCFCARSLMKTEQAHETENFFSYCSKQISRQHKSGGWWAYQLAVVAYVVLSVWKKVVEAERGCTLLFQNVKGNAEMLSARVVAGRWRRVWLCFGSEQRMERDRAEPGWVLADGFLSGVAGQEPQLHAPGPSCCLKKMNSTAFVQQRTLCTEPHLCGSDCTGLGK